MIRRKGPQKPTPAGAVHPPPNSLSAALPGLIGSREYGLRKVPQAASITSQHAETELSEGKFSKPYDPSLAVFL